MPSANSNRSGYRYDFADWLKQNLRYHRVTPNHLARRAGLRPSTICRIIDAEVTAPREQTIRKIQGALESLSADAMWTLAPDPCPFDATQMAEVSDDKLNRTPLAAWLKVLRHITASGKTPADVLRAIDTLNNFFSGERHA